MTVRRPRPLNTKQSQQSFDHLAGQRVGGNSQPDAIGALACRQDDGHRPGPDPFEKPAQAGWRRRCQGFKVRCLCEMVGERMVRIPPLDPSQELYRVRIVCVCRQAVDRLRRQYDQLTGTQGGQDRLHLGWFYRVLDRQALHAWFDSGI